MNNDAEQKTQTPDAAASRTLDAKRQAVSALMAQWPTPAEVTSIAARIGDAPAHLYTSTDASQDSVILHVHGGGFTAGAADLYGAMLGQLVLATGLSVLSCEYRLAPEHPFPASLHDVRAFLSAASEHKHVAAVVADSAGGALAVAGLRELPGVASSLILFSPLLDLASTAPSYSANENSDRMFSGRALESIRRLYLAGHDPEDLEASPLRGSLSSLPPALVFASESEVLRDDAILFCEAVVAQGGSAELVLEPDAAHVWPIAGTGTSIASRALAKTAAFIRSHYGRDTTC